MNVAFSYRGFVSQRLFVCMAGCVLSAVMMVTSAAIAEEDDTSAAPADATQSEPSTQPGASNRQRSTRSKTQPAVQANYVGWLELSGRLSEEPPAYVLGPQTRSPGDLRTVLTRLNHVADNPQYRGVVIYLQDPSFDLSQIDALDHAIQRVREKNKKVLIFAEAYDMTSYLLACSADEILLQHKGIVELTGLGVEEIYAAGLLEKIGMKADIVQVGKFKGADEQFTRREPSEFWSKNFDQLLDDLYDQVLARISKARNLTKPQVEQLFVDSWALSDVQLVQRKLVDRVIEPDLIAATTQAFGSEFEWDDVMGVEDPKLQADNMFTLMRTLFERPATKRNRATLAVIHAIGPITSGYSGNDSMFESRSVGSRTIVESLSDARDDKAIRGVVIRIDSPGGSALASEVIWQAIRELAKEKPVYVSIGPLAASGGYYIASAGHQIYVSPISIVGSIGVVGGKFVLGDLYQKLGLNVHRRARPAVADMFNSVEPFTDQQRELVRQSMQRVYEQFTDRVQSGRGKRLLNIQDIGEGRLFTGRQALLNGMADRLGSTETAVNDLAKMLNLKPGSYDVIDLPEPQGLGEFLEDMFSGFTAQAPLTASPLTHSARQLLGPGAWHSVSQVLSGMMLLRHEPVLVLMPAAFTIR